MSEKLKYTGIINNDIFEEYSEYQAFNTVTVLEAVILHRFEKKEVVSMVNELKNMIEEHYKADDKRFLKMKTANQVRDFHLIFCKHWISDLVKKNHPTLFHKIPQSFVMGQ